MELKLFYRSFRGVSFANIIDGFALLYKANLSTDMEVYDYVQKESSDGRNSTTGKDPLPGGFGFCSLINAFLRYFGTNTI